MQARHRKSLWSFESGTYVENIKEDEVWKNMNKLDEILHNYSEIFGFDKWLSNWLFFLWEMAETRRPPFSFLFILAIEGLIYMLKSAQVNNKISGFTVKEGNFQGASISHLQYVDDTLVICEVYKEQLKCLRVIFIYLMQFMDFI